MMIGPTSGNGVNLSNGRADDDSVTVQTVMMRQGATYRAMQRLLEAIRAEMECREAPACRYDVIVSQSPTQRGADLRGGDSQGRVWIRTVQETSPTGTLCPPWMWVDIEVGVLRCHTPVDTDDRSLPSEEAYAAEALLIERDRQAVAAAARSLGRPKMSVTSWRPYGPQSYAVGGITTFRFRRPT